MTIRRFRRSAGGAWLAVLLAVSGCRFLDPLNQEGLRVVLSPPDTAVNLGNHLQARALMWNAYDDRYPSEHFTYAGLDSSVSVERTGIVTGMSFGRARIVGQRNHLADTGWVSVVPPGILALSRLSGPVRLEVGNTDGSGIAVAVPNGLYVGGAAAWLPGVPKFVCRFYTPGGGSELRISDLLGNTTFLTSGGQDPRASRDGAWIYFQNGSSIWRVGVDGSGLEQITPGAEPDPSPGNTSLAFVRAHTPANGTFDLIVRDLTNGIERKLNVTGLWPRWSPNGNDILYWSIDVTSSPLQGAIFSVSADGTGLRRVSVSGHAYASNPTDWSSDGQWIVARSTATLDLIQVATGLTLPMAYDSVYAFASWRW